ncbi:MAG: glycosyl hydrolase, partial [Gemmatimonadetes bacterium]|nr:glycosyl hydrolase [Gemmatimonadota bacterium]
MYASPSSHGVATARALTLVAAVVLLGGATVPTEIRAQQGSSASTLDPGVLRAWKWRNIGPSRGGRSIAVAGSSSRPLEYYFGATGGGVWKTTNGGTDWMPMSDGYFTSASVGSIEVCPANPDVVYVGTGEGDFRTQFSTGDGAYKTTDGGKTWTHIGLDSGTGQQVVARMRVHPTSCDIVYAAVLGDPYGPTAVRGVFRSRDGGRTWQKNLYRSDQAGASDLT